VEEVALRLLVISVDTPLRKPRRQIGSASGLYCVWKQGGVWVDLVRMWVKTGRLVCGGREHRRVPGNVWMDGRASTRGRGVNGREWIDGYSSFFGGGAVEQNTDSTGYTRIKLWDIKGRGGYRNSFPDRLSQLRISSVMSSGTMGRKDTSMG